MKSQSALLNYGHQVVIANILETRKDTVDIITNKKQIIRLTRNSCKDTPNPVLLHHFNSYSVHSLEFDEENIEKSIIDHILKLYRDENL